MDRKSILIVVVSVALFLVMWQVAEKMYPPHPAPKPDPNAVVMTATGTNAAGAVVTTTSFAPAITLTNVPVIATNTPEQLVVITNANARYTFTSRGGGLKQVDLLQYPETVSRIRKKKQPIGQVATLNAGSAFPTLAITGGEAVQGDDVFSLMTIPDGVRAEKVLTNGLRIVKDFQLTNNYLILANVRLENVSIEALPLPAQEWAVGTATPMNVDDKGRVTAKGNSTYTIGTMWYDGVKADDKTDMWFQNKTFFSCFGGPKNPHWEFIGGATNVVWAAAHNQFFVLALMPGERAQAVMVRKVVLPSLVSDDATNDLDLAGEHYGFATTLVYPAFTLAATQSVTRSMTIYAGPKEYSTLARVAGQYTNNLDAVMGFGKISGIFSKALLLSMNGLHALKLPYGWCIVFITVFIKALFWPLTRASTLSMKRMQVLQPQMNEIRAKYKDDPAKMNRKVMEFMKENRVNPMSGCWPLLIQMPVFIGFFYMLRSAIELRGAPFLWIGDLSQPDTLFIIPGLNMPFNLLPLLMGVVMLWQSHVQPMSPGVDPAQQKLMRYMPLMFLLFMYNYSSGLALYWTVQNLLTVLQTKLTKNMVVPAPPSPLTPQLKKSK